MITLFSLANGDAMNDIFVSVAEAGLGPQMFLIVYVLVFFTLVQNVIIFIMMEGFETIRERIEEEDKIKFAKEDH